MYLIVDRLSWMILYVGIISAVTPVCVSDCGQVVLDDTVCRHNIGGDAGVCLIVDRLSWILLYVGIILVEALVITFICWKVPLFVNSNVVVLFLLFFLYGLSMICIAFLAMPFFHKGEIAGDVVSVVTMLVGLLYMAVVYSRDFSHREGPVSAVPPWCQWLASLLSPVAFTLAIDQVIIMPLSLCL